MANLWLVYTSMIFLGTEQAEIRPPEMEENESCLKIPDEAEQVRLIQSYYNNRGVFSSIFELDRVEKSRIDGMNQHQFDLHVRYYFVPVAGNAWGRTDSGYDQRIFYFVCEGAWGVTGMSGHMTARFP